MFLYKTQRVVKLIIFAAEFECPAGRIQFSVSGAETRDPAPRPGHAVWLPYKSVSPWGRTGCLLSYLSSTAPTRRVTCCFKRHHICWCHVGAWPTPSADHSSFTFTSLLIHIIFISACQFIHLSEPDCLSSCFSVWLLLYSIYFCLRWDMITFYWSLWGNWVKQWQK